MLFTYSGKEEDNLVAVTMLSQLKLTYRQPAQNGVLTDQICWAI